MRLTVRIIAETVAAHYGIGYRDLVSHRRPEPVVEARLVTYWLARQFTDYSLPQIGAALGDRDHSTIHHGARTVEQRLGRSSSLAEAVATLETALRAIELTMARASLNPPGDVDPLAVAWRVMASDRDAISPSKDEILALAIAVIGAEHEVQSRQQKIPTAEEPSHV